ncbi:hypothetical protein FOL47_006467 [Perkinsus chesapeaki]|uniref:Uncharacterized protein n=1 Tax=Perkinsus chesapeaki TaxID=330153 RepID=A0A7J6LS04_PERCH|nr:hypothetical protein FOL47_006467 [Perkinsus chesapeaki]
MSTTTGLCQAVFAVAFEPTALPSLVDQPTSTLLLLLASSVLGAIVNLLTLQVINYTSGLALKLLGVFRNNLPVFFGYITSVVGFLWYTHLQSYPTSPVEVEPDDDKAIELEEGRAE